MRNDIEAYKGLNRSTKGGVIFPCPLCGRIGWEIEEDQITCNDSGCKLAHIWFEIDTWNALATKDADLNYLYLWEMLRQFRHEGFVEGALPQFVIKDWMEALASRTSFNPDEDNLEAEYKKFFDIEPYKIEEQ